MDRRAAGPRPFAALLVAVMLAFGVAPVLATAPVPAATERELSAVIDSIRGNRLDEAMQRVERLIAKSPNFRLAHLIRGDLLLARGRPLQTFGDVSKTVPREKVDDLRDEALVRLRAHRERPVQDRVPRYVLQMNANQRYAIVVDSVKSRLYVFENVDGRARLFTDYYVSLGKRGVEKTREGDQKTPIGVYHVTANLPRSKLTDFYGSGAFPINYPNAWDRRLGRNGFGIWLHGTPSDTYSRPPRASDGCIVLSNGDLDAVARHVQTGLTPFIIADQIEWTDAATLEGERKTLSAAVEAWRADWESRDTARYLRHYSARFRTGNQDLAAWSSHKRGVNAGKRWIKVGVSQQAMFRYPRERDFVVVAFEQDYQSSNLSNRMRKVQYWTLEDGHWRIVYEGAA